MGKKVPSPLSILKLAIIAILIIGIITILVFFFIPNSPLQTWLLQFLKWLETIRLIYRALLMTAVQTGAVMIILPGTPFNMACGFIFGKWVGSAISVVSTDIAAILSFFIGRYLARDWAERQVEKRPNFKAIDKAVDKHGWYIIFLIRVSPVFPFGLCNYLFGLTQVHFVKYWISSTIGLAPYTIAYTYLGSLMKDLADMFNDDIGDDSKGSGSHSEADDDGALRQWIMIGIGAATTLLTVVVIGLVTRRSLKKAIAEVEEEERLKAAQDAEYGSIKSDISSIIATQQREEDPLIGNRYYK
eukprot:TRINITY_DN1719_c0_g2_i2.p1 TRINITY_DN1719_c0_g2~~TRINITY_DN1719_c0_g2_i2.p1  ORF type:complete len:301 (-),score=52.83 TRINITY_DN1719_c0_g2_i2:35-937(-)